MATLTIRKISDKVWKHTPSDGLAYIVSRLYIKSSGDKIRVVEFNGAIKSEYDYSDIVIYNIGGSAETGFTSSQEVLERLEDLGYIGFFNEGGAAPFNPSDLISSDAGNDIILGSDNKLFSNSSTTTPNLQQVTDEGAITTNYINIFATELGDEKGINCENQASGSSISIDSSGYLLSRNSAGGNYLLKNDFLSGDEKQIQIPNQSGTIALTSDLDSKQNTLTAENVGQFMNLDLATKTTPVSADTILARDSVTNEAVEIPFSEFGGGSGTYKRSYFAEWKLGGAMAASTSWYAQGALSGLRGTFTANSSLTPSNAFANHSMITPRYTLPFNAKIKSIRVAGWTNGVTAATVRLCVVRSNVSVAIGTTIQNSAIIGDVSFLLNDPYLNAFHKQFTSTGLTTTTQNAETEIRIFLFNNNQDTPLQDTIISIEFEEVI